MVGFWLCLSVLHPLGIIQGAATLRMLSTQAAPALPGCPHHLGSALDLGEDRCSGSSMGSRVMMHWEHSAPSTEVFGWFCIYRHWSWQWAQGNEPCLTGGGTVLSLHGVVNTWLIPLCFGGTVSGPLGSVLLFAQSCVSAYQLYRAWGKLQAAVSGALCMGCS